jgi:hypothetical protein
MKILINTSILLIILNNFSFPQFYDDSSETNSIIELMKIADETARQNYLEKGPKKVFTDEEIKHLAEFYYKCYNENPVGFQKYIGEEHERWEKMFTKNDIKPELARLQPTVKVFALRKKIAEKYGIPFAEVISTPAFLRCKFLPDKIDSMKSNLPSTKMNFDFLVEDVLKGDKFFSIGKTINIRYYYPTLFEEGGTYLIPITTRYSQANYKGEAFVEYLQENYNTVTDGGVPAKTFPIENETIKDCEYFGIKDTSWIEFKKYFTDTYLIFE